MSRTVREKGRTVYGVHPGVEMMRNWIVSLPEKTGRSLQEWIELTKKEGPSSRKERMEWLKTEHKLGTNHASAIVDRAEGKGGEHDGDEAYLQAAEHYVKEMFSGPKSGLLPMYDRLLSLGLGLGKDVKACPCKTIVPLYRRHVFAQIKPTTRTRIDLGFALKDKKPEGRLIDTGGFAKKDRITHRIPISRISEIDREVKHWLKVAYDLDS